MPNPIEPDGEHAPPAVVVGEGAGEQEQRGEDREVAADDVGLALERRDEAGRQLAPDVRQRQVHDRAVEEDHGRAEDRREHGPALGRGHRSPWRASSECVRGPIGASNPGPPAAPGLAGSHFRRLIYAAAVPGPVALVGAGEFLAPMAEFDRGLLEATGRPRPRVVVLPTAAAPDGEHTFRVWAEMGVEHFSALGAEVEPVLVRNAEQGHDAAALQAIGEADLVYLSGGHPRHLLSSSTTRRWAPRSALPTTAAR